MNKKTEKQRLLVFIFIAFGITFLMGFLMWYGWGKEMDLDVFPLAQVLYPAAGVILGYFLVGKKDEEMPRGFFCFYLLITAAISVLAILSVLLPEKRIVLEEEALSVWYVIGQLLILAGNIGGWIFLLAAGKEKRAAYGMRWKNGWISVFCVLLFVALYFLHMAGSLWMSEDLPVFWVMLGLPVNWLIFLIYPLGFITSWLGFFGEEYGWRYYLQPILQERFGLRVGVILLGVFWGLWHLPLDFFCYIPEAGAATAAARLIICIALGIFFSYAYMKTQNIWVPITLHFLSNSLVTILSEDYSGSLLLNQPVSWKELPSVLIVNGVIFGIFLLAKPFSCTAQCEEKKKEE